jgi:hypothetical protein
MNPFGFAGHRRKRRRPRRKVADRSATEEAQVEPVLPSADRTVRGQNEPNWMCRRRVHRRKRRLCVPKSSSALIREGNRLTSASNGHPSLFHVVISQRKSVAFERTSQIHAAMSAFRPKRTFHFCTANVPLGVKRTWLFAARVSAYDPSPHVALC